MDRLTLSKPQFEPETMQRRQCIHEMFELQVSKAPDAVAVSFGEEELTYRELNRRADALAGYLRSLGIGPESRVALYLERTPLMVVALLGVLKAGGAYVPIDLAYPQERASFMLEDAQAPVLLTQGSLATKLPAGEARIISLDSDWTMILASQGTPAKVAVGADNAAYVIYTSGSTGKPKGVIVTHHNVVRLLGQTAHWYHFNATDVWPLFHSYAFDVSVWELWGSLLNGGRLVVVPYLVTRSPHEFYKLLSLERVTVLNQTPSAFRQLIWAEETAPEKLPLRLRYVICAGEALELQSLKPWFERHGDETPRIVNMYGITETTVHSTHRVIREADLTSGVGSVIGVPIPDLQLYLVDDDLKLVKKGTPGEICVGGPGVARGYLNRPDLTAKRFLPDPFSPEPGARMYRSGDLAQYNANGELEYLGRMDHQVKIRGFRVELGEIESALNRHPAIRESVVLARDTPNGDKRLVAYCVPVDKDPNVTDLRQVLGTHLPDYMVPAVFVFLKQLPLTTNGKVDRRALPEPEGVRPVLKNPYVAPRNLAEAQLAEIWSTVLNVDRVGIRDSFFELGGDSIRAISILAAAQNAGLGLSLEQMFGFPTIEELATRATAADVDFPTGTEPFSLIKTEDRCRLPDDAVDAYPIGKLQLGMFFRNELSPASAAYHDVFTYRVTARFAPEALGNAVNRLVARHPVLRTSFHLAGYTEPLQVVHATARALFTAEDLSSLESAAQDEAIRSWIESEKRRAFDRSTPPMVRFHAQVLGPERFQFIISFHHSCIDGWSLAAVVHEIFRDYGAALAGGDAGLSAPAAYYRDFIALEREIMRSEEARRYWTDCLAGAAFRELPRWPKQFCASGHEQSRGPEIIIRDEVLNGLRSLAQTAGVPLKSVLLAAHQRVLSFLHGENDVVTGLISNGRPEVADGEKIIGLFLNAVPLRTTLSAGSWVDLAKATFAAEQRNLPYRRFPLAEVQKLRGGTPLFETAFDFVHFHVLKNLQDAQGIDVRESHYFEANDLTTYTTFMLDASGTNLELHLDYDPNTIPRRQIEEITRYYVATLEAMVREPEAAHDTFVPLSADERVLLLEEWNRTGEVYPRHACIHQLFEDRVRMTPDACAIACGAQTLTFAELNSRAEAIASHLRERGAGPGKLVGICLDRSTDMVAGLLGILKAGAAYVPLDPAYPGERLEFMIRDSGLEILLTSGEVAPLIPATSARLVCLEEIPVAAAGISAPSGGPMATPQDLAYVIYTSGSTGKPKGVQITHRSVVNLLCSAASKLAVTPQDSLLAVTTLSFDIAALELFVPLITGARLVIASRETASDGKELARLLESSSATVMQATPATWRLLIEAGWTGKKDLRVLCGGEALKPALTEDLLPRVAELWNFYGPTETTIWSTACKLASGSPISIGRPLANTSVYIVDRQLRPVPIGTAGELLIGGEGVARGYWNRSELTTERFIPNPFHPAAGKVYRTGDLARFLPDGNIECLGRLDQQLKVRGFRIEPGEIEAALKQDPRIAEAVVSAREDVFGDKKLIAYLVSRNGPLATAELREFAGRRLPAHMIPSHFVLLPCLPLTPNGKTDFQRLPGPEATERPPQACVAPRDQVEQAVADIWREVLEVTQVGVEDNFFELGGDSLSATRVFARMNRAFATDLSLREILEHPTIAQLAPLIRAGQGSAAGKQRTIPKLPRTPQV